MEAIKAALCTTAARLDDNGIDSSHLQELYKFLEPQQIMAPVGGGDQRQPTQIDPTPADAMQEG